MGASQGFVGTSPVPGVKRINISGFDFLERCFIQEISGTSKMENTVEKHGIPT